MKKVKISFNNKKLIKEDTASNPSQDPDISAVCSNCVELKRLLPVGLCERPAIQGAAKDIAIAMDGLLKNPTNIDISDKCYNALVGLRTAALQVADGLLNKDLEFEPIPEPEPEPESEPESEPGIVDKAAKIGQATVDKAREISQTVKQNAPSWYERAKAGVRSTTDRLGITEPEVNARPWEELQDEEKKEHCLKIYYEIIDDDKGAFDSACEQFIPGSTELDSNCSADSDCGEGLECQKILFHGKQLNTCKPKTEPKKTKKLTPKNTKGRGKNRRLPNPLGGD